MKLERWIFLDFQHGFSKNLRFILCKTNVYILEMHLFFMIGDRKESAHSLILFGKKRGGV